MAEEKRVETSELAKELRKHAKILHDETTLHTIAFLMTDVANRLEELEERNKDLVNQLADICI